MIYTFPSTFSSFEDYVAYTEDLRREHEFSRRRELSPEDSMREFPEMRSRVEELYLNSLHRLEVYKNVYKTNQSLYSKDLTQRIWDEEMNEATLGYTIKKVEEKVKTYRRMLSIFKCHAGVTTITDEDISKAKEVPMESLLSTEVKRGFIKCPKHDERTPSCKVYSDHLHCFSCGYSSDTIAYVMETQGKTFIDSVKYLCNLN